PGVGDADRSELAHVLAAEHLHEGRVRGQYLAVRRRLENAVDDVVEKIAEARLALAQSLLVALAPNRDAGELREARDNVELFRRRAARRVEIHGDRAVDAVARGHDRRRAARGERAVLREAGRRVPQRVARDVAHDDLAAERDGRPARARAAADAQRRERARNAWRQ